MLFRSETYSDVDIKVCGVNRYTDSDTFQIMLFGFSVNKYPVSVIDFMNGEELTKELIDMLLSKDVVKTSFNANFEITCLSKHLGVDLNPESWRCTAAQAHILGLPMSLKDVGGVLGFEKQKMEEGKELIKYFCQPCKPTKTNGGRTRNLPEHAPEKRELFKEYCKRDVEVEMQIRERLHKYPISESEQRIFCLDHYINKRGIMVDMQLVNNAVECDMLYKDKAEERAREITGLNNPNSVVQLKNWLSHQGVETDTLSKDKVEQLADETEGEVKEMLNLRLAMSKTSVKKYEAIQRSVCKDGRVRGLYQYYGANRTGRFSGRLVQMQNLPQNHISDLARAREIVKMGSYDELDFMYDSTPRTLSELIRTAFVAKPGCRFIISDESAIEARILAWLAGENWRLKAFREGKDIYCASASAMFGVPVEKNGINGELRAKGKIAELALGYGGSVGALTSMGALKMGLTEAELPDLVTSWRNSNPAIYKFWWDCDNAAINAITGKCATRVGRIGFTYESGMMFIKLPSGRRLAYVKPRMMLNKYGREGITYWGVGENKKWVRIETYGPKLCENIVQATARDILVEGMLRIADTGLDIVGHVHDEVIVEAPYGVSSVDEINGYLATVPEWADGLPLAAAGFESPFYKKD